ncbi:LL-diaminopimelate aminotransferase [Thermanaerosceptrum fracticalcis]|uniref:Aminotransferase n=1 Tax=Thermanaerosceptrum fracticalcis TaxID=1712410 RepID=A0A7G6E1R3_THEFR|nr:LL-diaminopimelate aminotransferase [Thermanaerosceptrum fracticalcis]QNB46017.1 LL-diaminopimelate aminotransferase [Thermanaerosceptrum fracticalcis]
MEATRIKKLPPYLFARIEKKIEEAKEKGIDIISFGIGDPDLPTPKPIIDELCKEAQNPANHQYPSSVGMLAYRQAVCEYYEKTHDVQLDPRKEVVTLIGSKEGIGHISFCYVDPGDINLVPDPGYPVYGIGTLLAGGEPYLMPLLEENNYLPDLAKIPEDIARKAKLMFINYPNNPTGAIATKEFFAEVVEFAKKYDIIVCHDAAYTEMAYEGYQPPSFLEVPGAKDVGIEFGSLSKPFNMTGWRIGWAVGRQDVIEALGRLKSNLDSGQFQAIQYAGIKGLTGPKDSIMELRRVYERRRDMVVEGLNRLGWNLSKPKATFYIWARVPKGYTSAEFAEYVLEKAGVIITPGNGYGHYGEGYFRISITIPDERIKEGIARLEKHLVKVEF